ncbi:hypothetical protein E2C01_083403 [Portunus trituberculatus]|uniref:Uncharacterized protein n=1 Tax=Portunus trituberculatus TaxID=210409 RepID=A0A5B7J4K2_PORTR|nr:hypothetical protein [Portunus trituberculatus]
MVSVGIGQTSIRRFESHHVPPLNFAIC